MTNVLIRDVPTEDLERIRVAARAQGVSLQNYLRGTVHAQARYLRRQEALEQSTQRLAGRGEVSDDERQAVLDAIDTAHRSRSGELGGQSAR